MTVKLRKPIEIHADSPAMDGAPPTPVPLLAVCGLVITRATLVEALRAYVPGLVDVEVVDDGERFVLVLSPPG